MANDIIQNNTAEAVDNLTSLEPAVVPEPSTPAAQAETELARTEVKDDKMQERLTGKKQTPEFKEQRDIKTHRVEAEKAEKAAIAAQSANDEAASNLQTEIDKLQADLDYAQQNDLPGSALAAKIKELEAEKLRLSPIQANAQIAPEPIQEAPIAPGEFQDIQADAVAQPSIPEAQKPSISKVDQLSNEIKAQNTAVAAQQLALQDEIDEQRNIADKAMQTLRDEDTSIQKIDNERFWNSKSTWQKIGLGIAMMLGGKQGQSVVQNFIDKDIESQKLNNNQKLAKRQEAYKRVNMEIDRLASLTSDQGKIEKLKMAKAQLRAKEKEAFRQRQAESLKKAQAQLLGTKLASAEGITREEFFGLDKELKKTGVTFKDNMVRFASSAEAAKKVSEAIADANSAMNDFKELQKIGKEFLGGAIPLSVAQAKGKLYQQSAIGKLRLELFGPGVLTDIEQKIARSIIGNPAKITNLTHLEMAKLDAITAKLRHSVAQKIRLSGIKLPPSENEINIAKLMKIDAKNKNVDLKNVKVGSRGWKTLKERAYKALNKNNMWKAESEF